MSDSPGPFIWDRSATLALANQHCTLCHGLGMRSGNRLGDAPCHCVHRAIFRACLARYRECQAYGGRVPRRHPGVMTFDRTREEYCADFLSTARRALGKHTYSGKVFQLHFVRGLAWRKCCPKLGVGRGEFFHEVYRVMQTAGKALAEKRLWPLDEYFGGKI